jgi:hypothetical protein
MSKYKFSSEEIAQLKEQNPSGVFRVKLDNDSEYYFRKMTRKELSASVAIASTDAIRASEVQVENTLLLATESDKALLKTDMRVLLAVVGRVNEINKARESEMEEL